MTWGTKVARPVAVVLVATAVAAIIASIVSVTGFAVLPLPEAIGLVRALAASAFIVAGVLRLARWRITGESHCGLISLALLLMGGVSLPSTAVARGLAGPGDPAAGTCVRVMTVGTILVVTAMALRNGAGERFDLDRRVVRPAVVTVGGVTALLVLGHDRLPSNPPVEMLLLQGAAVALALAWLTAATGAWARRRHVEWAGLAAPLLVTMGVAEVFRIPARPATTLVALALTAVVGFVVATSAVVALMRAAQQEHAASEHLSQELADAREEAESRVAWRAELTHDARSTLAGIRAAMRTLERHGAQLDQPTADRLRVATFAELSHLEQLVIGPSDEGVVFDVADIARTVTDVRRAAGQSVEILAEAGLVLGAPHDVATVLQNLLVNAAVHASGSLVRVEVRRRDTCVELVVSDDGPGLPSHMAGSVFERGVRGYDSAGSGLGLSIARSLARKNGGELELTATARGTSFRLTLPAAGATSSTLSVSVPAAS